MAKNILKSINFIIIFIAIVLVFLLVGVQLFGIKVYIVLSGSMEPTYKVGSIIYVREIEANDLKINDVISFKLSEDIVATHRIVDIVEDEKGTKKFTTKGDANETVDKQPVKEIDVIGKPIFSIPYLGYISSMLNTKQGKIIIIEIGITLLIVNAVIDSIVDKKKRNEEWKLNMY